MPDWDSFLQFLDTLSPADVNIDSIPGLSLSDFDLGPVGTISPSDFSLPTSLDTILSGSLGGDIGDIGGNLGDLLSGGGDVGGADFGLPDTTFYPDPGHDNLQAMVDAGVNPGDDFWLNPEEGVIAGDGTRGYSPTLSDQLRSSGMGPVAGAPSFLDKALSALKSLGKGLAPGLQALGGARGGGMGAGGGYPQGITPQGAVGVGGISMADLRGGGNFSGGAGTQVPIQGLGGSTAVGGMSVPAESSLSGANVPTLALGQVPQFGAPSVGAQAATPSPALAAMGVVSPASAPGITPLGPAPSQVGGAMMAGPTPLPLTFPASGVSAVPGFTPMPVSPVAGMMGGMAPLPRMSGLQRLMMEHQG
jgi:hypothetical protein